MAEEGLLVGSSGGEIPRLQYKGFYPETAGPLKRKGLRAIADDESDGGWNALPTAGRKDRLKIGSLP